MRIELKGFDGSGVLLRTGYKGIAAGEESDILQWHVRKYAYEALFFSLATSHKSKAPFSWAPAMIPSEYSPTGSLQAMS